MSTDHSYANRAKSIKRAVALLAMAADKSSIHEASIAKKRADSLIKKYTISEKELILAGWKKPSASNTHSGHEQAKSTAHQSTSGKQSAESAKKQADAQRQAKARAANKAYREWQERQNHERQAWKRAEHRDAFSKFYDYKRANLEVRINRATAINRAIFQLLLIACLPSLLVVFFEVFMIRPFTEGVTVGDVVANKAVVKKHLKIAVGIIALAVSHGFLFGYLKRIWVRRFVNDMREEVSKRGLS